MGILCQTTDERPAGLRRTKRQGGDGRDTQPQLCRRACDPLLPGQLGAARKRQDGLGLLHDDNGNLLITKQAQTGQM